MTAEEQKHVKTMFVMTAAYYKESIDDAVLKMYAADLEDLPFAKVVVAFKVYRLNCRNRRAPIPADIRNAVAPPETDEDIARDTSTRIIAAVSKRGYYWPMGFHQDGRTVWDGGNRTFPSFDAALAEEFGETGARVVAKMGGWAQVHQMISSSDSTIASAQLRELALSIRRRSKAGSEPALPSQQKMQIAPGNALPPEL